MREEYLGVSEGAPILDFDGHAEVLVETPNSLKALNGRPVS